jgi:hypothetical protein
MLLASRRGEAEQIVARLGQDPGLPLVQLLRFPTTDLGPAEIDEMADILGQSRTIKS